jgi:hypothetical protein
LGRACTARFAPRIRRRSTFRVRVDSDGVFEASTSRPLTIAPARRRSRAR